MKAFTVNRTKDNSILFVDVENHFIEQFNRQTGFYVRSGVIVDGKDTGEDPFMRCAPSLLDIGIMGNCTHAHMCTVGCYQGGTGNWKPNMILDDYKKIIDQVKRFVFQVALGGHGDPNKHENFGEILEYTRSNGIVPNYTTSGFNLTDEEVQLTKRFCGAVAVSWYRRPYTLQAINKFIEAECKTNIHYVLGNDSIDEAIRRLEDGTFPKGVNAVIFLLHKPVGCGREENVLRPDNPKVKKFFEVVDECKFHHKIGFDSCTVPGLINYTMKVNRESFDTCEGGRHSAYITPDMKMLPCSFDNQSSHWAVDLNNHTVLEAWKSDEFERFRNHFRWSCPKCSNKNICKGGCPIVPQIGLCSRKERTYKFV